VCQLPHTLLHSSRLHQRKCLDDLHREEHRYKNVSGRCCACMCSYVQVQCRLCWPVTEVLWTCSQSTLSAC
jgi:hypothetical protein